MGAWEEVSIFACGRAMTLWGLVGILYWLAPNESSDESKEIKGRRREASGEAVAITQLRNIGGLRQHDAVEVVRHGCNVREEKVQGTGF